MVVCSVIGPLLGRCGKNYVIAQPGGDKIGRLGRLAYPLPGLQEDLGANFVHDDERNVYQIQAKKLKGCYMLLDEALGYRYRQYHHGICIGKGHYHHL